MARPGQKLEEMQMRYGCFELRTSCSSCGQSLPINGPFRLLTCSACFQKMRIPIDTISGFLNDLEEEYQGFSRGQGSGGTLFGGGGTYKYGYWRLEPRCSSCKKILELPDPLRDGRIECSGCGRTYYGFAAPEWLVKAVPSASYCITPQQPPDESGQEVLDMDEGKGKPIVMSCPQCGGALSVSSKSERIMECGYCSSEVYIPDAVWQRLHPVRTSEEWFVVFQGKNLKQLLSERRARDKLEESEDLREWKLRNIPKKVKSKIRSFLGILIVFIFLVVVFALIGGFLGLDLSDISKNYSDYVPFLVIPVSLAIPLWMVFRTFLLPRYGSRKECREAMAELSKKHGWEHGGTEYGNSIGYVHEKYRGRDIEIDPSDDYAIEVELHDSLFYLRTEPPGYPHDGVYRFSSHDSDFNDLFPIRYAKPELTEKIESSPEAELEVLAPVLWFLERWRSRLGRMLIDWSGVSVHLAPGHEESESSGSRFIPAGDLEPLLEDMMILASGMDAIASGREPDLPERESRIADESITEP